MRREGDVVLVYYQEKPSFFARIEAIQPDVKKNWYQVTLLVLTIPPHAVTWILREEYINGTAFTMGGNPMKLEEVKSVLPTSEQKSELESEEKKVSGKPGTVLPFKKP